MVQNTRGFNHEPVHPVRTNQDPASTFYGTSNKSTTSSESSDHNQRNGDQRGNVPFSLKSRLLAPTESEYVPAGRIHDWLTTSQIDRS